MIITAGDIQVIYANPFDAVLIREQGYKAILLSANLTKWSSPLVPTATSTP